MRTSHGRSAASRSRGFTLLEITIAMMIFFLMISMTLWITAGSNDQTLAAEHARQLRMLAEMKMGEIAVFERHYDDEAGEDQRFDDLPEGLRDLYADWTWSLQIEDVTAFGIQKDENARYLFGAPDSATTTDAAGGTTGGDPSAPGAAKKGETQLLRQLVLTVKAPGDDGEGDSIELVTFLPLLPQKTAAAPAEAPK